MSLVGGFFNPRHSLANTAISSGVHRLRGAGASERFLIGRSSSENSNDATFRGGLYDSSSDESSVSVGAGVVVVLQRPETNSKHKDAI